MIGCIKFRDIESSEKNFFSQELAIHRKAAEECKASIGNTFLLIDKSFLIIVLKFKIKFFYIIHMLRLFF